MASPVTFNDYFAGQRMTQIAQSEAIKRGVPRVVPDEFFRPGPTRPFNDKVQWQNLTRNRGGAKIVQRASVPQGINLGNQAWAFATLLNSAEQFQIDQQVLSALFSDYAPIKANAEMWLANQMQDFDERFETTRTHMVCSTIRQGAIYVASDGQIQVASSSPVATLGSGFNTSNKITKDGTGSTYSIGDWSDPATDISKAIRDLQNVGIQRTRYPLTTILYGSDVPSYLIKNETVAPYFARNQQFNPQFTQNGEIPDGTLGMKWRPVRLSYHVAQAVQPDGSSSETVTAWFPNDFLFICPDMSPAWYEMIEGGTTVPRGIWGASQNVPTSDLNALVNGYYQIAYGKAAYGKLEETGPSLVQRDCCGPVIKNYAAVFAGRCATATP